MNEDIFNQKIKVIKGTRDVFQPKLESDQNFTGLKGYLFPSELFINKISYALCCAQVYNGTYVKKKKKNGIQKCGKWAVKR